MQSPRRPGQIVRIRVPETFRNFREVDDLAPVVVAIMNGKTSFDALPLGSSAFVAIKLAMLDADTDDEKNMGIVMMRAIKAFKLEGRSYKEVLEEIK